MKNHLSNESEIHELQGENSVYDGDHLGLNNVSERSVKDSDVSPENKTNICKNNDETF